jgi:aminopeptidase N
MRSRTTSRTLLSLAAFAFLVAARGRVALHPVTPPLDALPPDIYSFAEPAKITTKHVSLDLTVDSVRNIISGSATHTIENLSGTDTLLLDTADLTIERVLLDDGSPATFTLGAGDYRGRALAIAIKPSTKRVTVHYSTSPDATGLFWNTAEQSYGRRFPYLYSQNEPDDARTWIPVQDTPSIRMTYDATVRVDEGLMALMSAENPTSINDEGLYTFRMPEAIPAYLIAIAVGRFEFHDFGGRTGVYAEPELIDDAAWELSYLPEMLTVAEEIAGPYPFGRYDVLLMPPTYVIGGMEHPRLNFINPFSVVTGNRPATRFPSSLIAHELAHSWSGDATTLATWADIWLNEGITEYLTMRIIEEMSGVARAEYTYYTQRLSYSSFARNNRDPRSTLLHRPTTPDEPADWGFNTSAYTKGQLFMRTLEDGMGRDRLDAFLRDYFTKFSFRWVDERNFISLLRDHLGGDPQLDQLRVREWIYDSGLPVNVSAATSSRLVDRVNEQVIAFRGGRVASALDTRGWTPLEEEVFLALADSAIGPRMAEVDAMFGFSQRVTPPFTWLRQIIRNNHAAGDAAIERLLMRGGTNGQIIALYAELAAANKRTRARELYERAKNRYEAGVRQQLSQILGVPALRAAPPAVFRKAA